MSAAKIVLLIELVLVGLAAITLGASSLLRTLECSGAMCLYVGETGGAVAGALAILAWPIGVFGIGSGIRFRHWTTVWVSVGVVALPLLFALYVSVLRTMVAG